MKGLSVVFRVVVGEGGRLNLYNFKAKIDEVSHVQACSN
jgi:hypothetical protein